MLQRRPILRYIFGEENEPEQVGEQELHRPVQAPWPIGSDIGVTVLGSTIDILQRRCDEQFAIHRAKDPELLGGMIDTHAMCRRHQCSSRA